MAYKKRKFKTYDLNLIEFLRISISVKENITYWVFFDSKWKRIAKEYYYILVDKGIKIINKKSYKVNDIVECRKFSKKKELGQFYTINCDYILQNMFIPDNVKLIIEPFGGCGSLVKWISEKTSINAESYDIVPKFNGIIKRDIFKDIPVYKNKFVITNPPYLSKNKAKEKKIFNFYKTDDLYKCFIMQLLSDVCLGGILIVPLNFFCSFRKNDLNLRKRFLSLYDISLINIFEERVFSDTSYTVCSFMFKKKVDFLENSTSIYMYPLQVKFSVLFTSKNLYSFNSNIFNLSKSNIFTVKKTTKLNYLSKYATNIMIQCIDNKKTQINASIVSGECSSVSAIKKMSGRAYLFLSIKPAISLKFQKKLIMSFNNFVEEKRNLFFSLFLSQYREFGRKRIAFNLVYDIFSHLLKIHAENGNRNN